MKKETFKQISKAIVSLLIMAVLLWGSVPQPAYAVGGVIIDEFEEIADAQIINVTLATSPQQSTLDHASIIGTERDAQVVVTAGSGTMTSNTSDPGGYLNHSQPVGLRGRTILTWDGNDNNAAVLNATGLGGVNLAAPTNNAFLLGVVSADLVSQLQIQVYSSAANFSTATLSIPAGTAQTTFPITFASFVISGGTGANFTNVGAIVMTINSAGTPTAALDLVLDFLVAGESGNFMDLGDLPDSYGTLIASNGPRHSTANLFLGPIIDNDTDGSPSGTAVGDDTSDGSDDEDGVSPIGDWTNGATGGQFSIILGGDDPSACISGWMDFNNDGDFGDAGEQIYDTVLLPANGPNTVPFPIPASTFPPVSPGILTLNSRFRVIKDVFGDGLCLSIGNGGDEVDVFSTGSYVNGEVEDYQFTTVDYGDLPAVYNTTNNGANGARHTIGSLYLGPTVDPEVEGKENASALGDDLTDSTDDEDGIIANFPWVNGAAGGSIDIVVNGGAGCFSGWIDWNNDGDMNDAGEQIFAMLPVNTGTTPATFNVPVGTFPTATTLFARYRLVPDVNANGNCGDDVAVALTGLISNGEVEDYLYAVRDYGDLPASYNNTTFGVDGARHVVGSLFLGATVDGEFNGQESAIAMGDDSSGVDDEDGIGFTTGVGTWGDGSGNVNVTVTGGSACVMGWADYNNDGSFNDDINDGVGSVSELMFSQLLTAGTTGVVFNAPRSTVGGGTFAYPGTINMRFRLFPLNDPLFTARGLALTGGCPNGTNTTTQMATITAGEGSNGEVEDYQASFSPTAVTLHSVRAQGNDFVSLALVLGMVFSVGSLIVVKRYTRRQTE